MVFFYLLFSYMHILFSRYRQINHAMKSLSVYNIIIILTVCHTSSKLLNYCQCEQNIKIQYTKTRVETINELKKKVNLSIIIVSSAYEINNY